MFKRSLALLVTLSVGLTAGLERPVASPAFQADGVPAYEQIRAFTLTGGVADLKNVVFKRDRVEMTLNGTLYFAAPVNGRVTGAVFVGDGTMKADVPSSPCERDNVRRLLGAELVESDFRTAVFRFTDDSFEALASGRREGTAPQSAQQLANESSTRFTKETGANLAARLASSILNNEAPGVFTAQFDGGRRGRFTYVLDHQGRIPVGSFRLTGGEKGLIYAHQSSTYINEVWMAFYALGDYARGTVEYSDHHDLVDVSHYAITIDLRDFNRQMGLAARMTMQARADMRALPLKIGEGLSLVQEMRLRNQLRARKALVNDRPAQIVQEDWEGGFTVLFPEPVTKGAPIVLDVSLEGDFVEGIPVVPECFYPLSNETWYPRHGYLDRATYDLTFLHRKRDRIASIGTRMSDAADLPNEPQAAITRYEMKHPVALAVFALGSFERKTQQVTWEAGGAPIPLEFHSMPNRVTAVKHDFLLAELDNSVRYFAAMFGPYPYETFGAAFHPFAFGQGFPTLLMIPPTTNETKGTYAFLAHETSHQWWGNIVAWRSYRDQWLSEGFAEYSGVLYAGKRDREKAKAAADLIRALRESLRNPPRTLLGVGSGRLNDIGPIVLGLRLNTTKSVGAYQALIYHKGALVLRMLHFLMSHPTTLDDSAFIAMMKDFVDRHRNGAASTEDFAAVAGQHFARTPIAQKFGLRDLNWFFRQWVYETALPSYELQYELTPQPDGSVLASGVVRQENAGPDWLMVLPIVFSFDNNQEARTTVRAAGPSTPFELKLPMKPRKVELDPDSWILSDRTTTRPR